MPLVEIDDLSISFGRQVAVDHLSLAIERGERFGIIGESGSGKSMTALAIAGLLPESAVVAGHIAFDGAQLPNDEKAMARLRGRRVGMVFQEPMTALNPLMRIGAQIEEALALADAGASAGAVVSLLDEVGLEPRHARRYPHQLSGGQRQRVMIAMALASEPDLMIADEPTSALDVITQRTVLDLIRDICQRRNMTLLFISHDIRAVAALCDRIGVMQGGSLVELGATARVLAAPQDDYTRRLLTASQLERRQRPDVANGEVLLRAKAVSKTYRQGGVGPWRRTPLRAVDGVTFDLPQGMCVALVGPSGCGKTTLARMIVGLDNVSAGSFELGGTVYHGRDVPKRTRAQMSLVFQDPFSSFDPRMSVGESVAEPLYLRGLPPMERQARAAAAIEAVGLNRAMLSRYPHEFSGGQRQRLSIARALVTRPSLVVLDEPVSALDVSIRGDVLGLLARLQVEQGLSYLLISHDLDLVAAVADHVLIMDAGKIVESGRPDDIFAKPRHEMTRALVAARLPDVG